MGAENVADLDLALRALADGNRRSILKAIQPEALSVGAIAEKVGLSQQTTSHHLTVLKRAGLADGTRDGTRHLFAIRADGLAAVRAYVDDFWPDKLSALKTVIETREADDHG